MCTSLISLFSSSAASSAAGSASTTSSTVGRIDVAVSGTQEAKDASRQSRVDAFGSQLTLEQNKRF